MLSRNVKIGLSVIAGGLVLGFSGKAKAKSKSRRTTSDAPWDGSPYVPPKPFQNVPFAQAAVVPVFPISPASKHKRRLDVSYRDINGKGYGNGGRRFGTDRDDRHHAGIDLFANTGDVVLAPERGVIIATQNFLPTIDGAGDDAMLIEGENGITFLLGEIDEKAFGLGIGDFVERGQPVAKVALTSNNNHMLHFETYRAGQLKNQKWLKGTPAPSHLLDPSDYLLRARAAELSAPVA